MNGAVLVPGYGGGIDQPIIKALVNALNEAGMIATPIAFSTRTHRPSKDYGLARTRPGARRLRGEDERRPDGRSPYATEIAELRAYRDTLRAQGAERIALVGRSFGGRICAFLAAEEPPDALAILGHPISPPGRARPRDEAALEGVACPTLVVQGDRDELGPMAVLERIAGRNPRIDLVRVAGAGHDFGRKEPEAVLITVRWLTSMLR